MSKESFQKSIGYRFNNPNLLKEALTHSSAANENPKLYPYSNQRLEFLGDSILNMVIGNHLYKTLKTGGEGSLSKLRSLIVCEKGLVKAADPFQLSRHIVVGKNEKAMGVGKKPSVVADAMEALIGAIFVDGGLKSAEDFVLFSFEDVIQKALAGQIAQDYKTEIQEFLQKNGEGTIEYILDKQEGPPHDRTFHMSLWYMGKQLGRGSGKTKKEAEQKAAKAALEVESVL